MNQLFKHSIFIVLLTCCGMSYADVPAPIKDPSAIISNEISRLDTLIQATEQSLEEQRKLREMIYEYQKLQDKFEKNPNDNELLFKIIKSAYKVLQSIKENHLTQTFDTEFIDELTIMSQPATKRGIPK